MPQHIYYLDRSLLLGKYVYKRALTTFGNIIRDFGTVGY
jgi:hypothetical protein